MKVVTACGRSQLYLRRKPPRRRFFVTRSLLKAAPGTDVQWEQDTDEVMVAIPVQKSITKRNIQFTVHPKRLDLQINGSSILTGSLEDVGTIDPDGSYWYMDDTKETEESKCLTLVLLKKTMGYESFSHLLEKDVVNTTITNYVCVSVEIDKKKIGVIVFGLYGSAAPETVNHFLSLVDATGAVDEEQELKQAIFKTIRPGQYAEFGLPEEKKTPRPYVEQSLIEEPRGFKHDKPGLLSVNSPESISDFTLTFSKVSEFDDKRTVFGKVVGGIDLVARIEAEGDEETGEPRKSVVISECYQVKEDEIETLIEDEKKRQILGIDGQ